MLERLPLNPWPRQGRSGLAWLLAAGVLCLLAAGGLADGRLGHGLELALLGAGLVALAGCGGRGAFTGPSTVPAPSSGFSPSPPPPARPGDPPAFMVGAYVRSADAPEAARYMNAMIVVPTYGDNASTAKAGAHGLPRAASLLHEDAEGVASALVRANSFAFVSAHHVFGNPRDTWAAGWAQTRAWLQPIEATGRVLGIYVIDEATAPPEAIAMVRAAGYRTMSSEVLPWAGDQPRGSVDFFGVTCYYNRFEWCADGYRNNPHWNVVIAPLFTEPAGNDFRESGKWAELGQGRRGVFFWVWRWPQQTGIADDPALLAQFRSVSGR